tara:strand:+ start:39496 stop:40098 length:603 start_codon:yes stop_codon:yes gene_type:complete
MRNTLLLIAIATTLTGGTLSAGDGWGQKQTSRTIGGVLGGATVGGIIGHQHGKQKEGIIIGSVLGMIIGNQSGKGADARNERQRQEQIAREQAHQRELQRREQERMRSRQVVHTNPDSPVHGGRVGTDYTYMSHEEKQLLAARLRAERAERELQAELERQRQIEERRRLLEEYRERERQARERLLRAKGYTPESHPQLYN